MEEGAPVKIASLAPAKGSFQFVSSVDFGRAIPAALSDAPPEEFAVSEGMVDAAPPTVRPDADDEGTVKGKKPNIFQRIFGGNKKKEQKPSSQRP